MILDTIYDGRLDDFGNRDMNYVAILAIDPGKSNGVCAYSNLGELLFMATVAEKDMPFLLNCLRKVHTCIVEDFLLYPNKSKAQAYSTMNTSRVIGVIEGWAAINQITLKKQKATVKNTAYKWAGLKPLSKSNPLNHALDAHIHFIYWAITTHFLSIDTLITKAPISKELGS